MKDVILKNMSVETVIKTLTPLSTDPSLRKAQIAMRLEADQKELGRKIALLEELSESPVRIGLTFMTMSAPSVLMGRRPFGF